uniref:Uncharacterized protein n=1 Tax=Arundo donax TaxID=35708 RepID=A0A0A9D423_ARUDO
MDAARRERRHHQKAAAAAAGGVPAGGAGGRGGAAAAAARAAYGDVFGGPPRFAAPFGGAPLDYAEVFGGVAATCSIPFLDLPPAAAVGGDNGFFACNGKGDYGEIFGRFDFADFAVSYEDLFAEPEPEPELEPEREPEMEEIASSSGSSRSSIKKESSQLEDEAPVLPQHSQNLDHRQHFKEHKFSPISFHPDTDSQQFVMSYNKTTERRPDDLVEVTTFSVEPPMDFVIDSRNLSHGPATNHVSRIDDGTMANGNNEKNPCSASVSTRSPESDVVIDQKQQSPSWPPISGSVFANEDHKSSDSNSSRTSGTLPNYAFLRVSDVDAQTQPIKVQPPLRQQPKLCNRKESAEKGSINLVNHSCTPTSPAHSTLSNSMPQTDKKADAALSNADVNPTSASAAMKEAMDFAEARLKAAKELLERKGESFKLRKKPSHHRSTRSTEIKAPGLVEVDTSEQKLPGKKPSKEEKNPEELPPFVGATSNKHKKLNAVRSDNFDDTGKRVLLQEKPQKMMQHWTESCQISSKLEKLDNWRSGDEFYELIGDDQKCKTDKPKGEDDKCERTNPITGLSNDNKSETEFSAADSDLERYEKLWEVNDGRDLGVKHVNLREDNTASVDKDRVSVTLEASTENMAHQEIRNSNLQGFVTPENATESHDDDDDNERVELPSVSDTSTKLDFNKDMSGSLSEAGSSGNHASDNRDLGDSSPKVSPVVGTSQEHTTSKLVLEVPCDGEMQCTSGSSEKMQESPEACNTDISRGSNIKSLILEELEGSYVGDAFLRGESTVEQEGETYGREKFNFIGETLRHNKDTKINRVFSEEVEKVELEEKVGPCLHPEETVVDLDAVCPEEDSEVTLQNNNLADRDESNILNVFEVASKLIKRDLDQETNNLISDSKDKESEETTLENSERTGTEVGSAHGDQEDQKSSDSTIRGQSDIDAKCSTTVDEVGSESFSGTSSDSTTRTTINSKDGPPSSSEMYTHMQHPAQKDESATSQTSNRSVPGLEETGEVYNGERELPTEKATCEEKKRRANRMEEDTTARISKSEHGPSPLEKNHSLPKSAESPIPVSAETLKKEALGVQRAKERENITIAESASEKDKGSSRRTEEAKESKRRLGKERELTEERETKKLEEEERERERKKDRLAVERATREAHERAFAEAREKAEKNGFGKDYYCTATGICRGPTERRESKC